MPLSLQNFQNMASPPIGAQWLNLVDGLLTNVFQQAQQNPAARSALCSDAPLEVVNGGTGNRTGPGLPTQAQFNAQLALGPPYALTAIEIAGGVTPVNFWVVPYNALRYAVADGVTNAAPGLQAIINALPSGGSLYFPAVAQFWSIAQALVLPAGVTLTLYGDGYGSRITQTTSGLNVFTSGSSWSAVANYSQVSKLFLSATAGNYGLALNGNCRTSVRNCIFAGFTAYPTSAGIGIIDCLILDIEDNYFVDSVNGIYAVGSTNTAWNGGRCMGNDFEANTGYAVLADYLNGVEISGNTMESCYLGGIKVYNGGGGLKISGNYFEQNYTAGTAGAVEFADINLGANSYVKGVEISGNYFNGNDATARSVNDYVPIRIKYANGIVTEGNMLNTGSNFINFETGCEVSQCRFGLIGFDGSEGAAFDYSITATATYSAGTQAAPTALPSVFNFVTNGVTIEGLNRIADTINQQYLRYLDLPISSSIWTTSFVNGSLVADGVGVYVDSSATASSSAIASVSDLGLSNGVGQATIDFTKEIILDCSVNNITAGTSTGASWFMLAGAATAADLSTAGFGFKVIDNALWGICCDGTTTNLVNLGTSLSVGVMTQLKLVWTYPSVTWYVNGVSVGDTSTNTPEYVQATGILVLSTANGANAAHQRLGLFGCRISVSQ